MDAEHIQLCLRKAEVLCVHASYETRLIEESRDGFALFYNQIYVPKLPWLTICRDMDMGKRSGVCVC